MTKATQLVNLGLGSNPHELVPIVTEVAPS